jgi:hypothetical protein
MFSSHTTITATLLHGKAGNSPAPQSDQPGFVITADMADGQALPPFFESGSVWRVVARCGGRTVWRRERARL